MKFMQLGDTHVGYRQYGLKARERDFRIAFGKAMELADKEKPDVLLITGDVFETTRPDPADLNFVRDWLDQLRRGGTAVAGIEGNHDCAKGEILKNLEITEVDELAVIDGIAIYGIPYIQKSLDFRELLQEVPPETDVLLIHQTLSEVADIFADVSADDIAELCPNVRYVAMGHIHDHHTFSRGDMRLVYGGATEMNDIDESRDKSIPFVEMSPGGGAPEITLVPLDPRPIEKIVLHEESDVENLYKNLKDHENHLLYVVCKNTLTRQLCSVLKEADEYGIIYTVNPVSDTSKVDVKKIQSWERSRSAVDLKKIIEEDFEGLPRERSLVMALLETPDNAKATLEEYVDEQLEASDEADHPEA